MAGIIRVCAMSLAPIKPQPRAGAPTFVMSIQYPPDVRAAHLSWARTHRLDSSRDDLPPRMLCRKSLFHDVCGADTRTIHLREEAPPPFRFLTRGKEYSSVGLGTSP